MSTFSTEGSALRLLVAIERLSSMVSQQSVNKRRPLPFGYSEMLRR